MVEQARTKSTPETKFLRKLAKGQFLDSCRPKIAFLMTSPVTVCGQAGYLAFSVSSNGRTGIRQIVRGPMCGEAMAVYDELAKVEGAHD